MARNSPYLERPRRRLSVYAVVAAVGVVLLVVLYWLIEVGLLK